jgi:hypothetical protein
MGRRKGDNPFKTQQKESVNEKSLIIDGYIASLPKGVRFDNIRDLIKVVASVIGCATTTVERQQVYMNKLYAKFAEMNPDADKIDPNHTSPLEIKKQQDYYKAKVENLVGDLRRKEKHYQSQEYINSWLVENSKSVQPKIIPYISDSLSLNHPSANSEISDTDCSGNEPSWQQRFEEICEAFYLFIKKMDKNWDIKYDRKADTIMDSPSGMEEDAYIDVYVPDPNEPTAKLRYLRQFLDGKGR